MSRSRLSLASVLLLGTILGAPACKRTASGDGDAPGGRVARGEGRRAAARPNLPRPYALPDKPPMAVHVGVPAQVLAGIDVYLGRKTEDPRALLRSLANTRGPLEVALVSFVDLRRPWDAATIEGATIANIPIEKGHVPDVKRLLEGKPAEGKFGAVNLQRAADDPGPKLAWLDEQSATLVLADDLRGLATGSELGRKYGKQQLSFTIDAAQAKAQGAIEFPFARINLGGEGIHDFHVTTEGPATIEGLETITDGALTGLLSSPEIAAAATSRYAGYQQIQKSLTSRANRMLDDQNFLVRGVIEDMVKRFNTVVRSWNGRVLIGVGPQRHVVVALGTEDPARASNSIVSLVNSVMGNIELASSFGVSVPRFKFRKNRATSNGVPIHVVALANARKQIPAEFASLLDSEGNLRIAFAGSPRAGAVMVAIGPEAAETLSRWIDHTKQATPGNATRDHFAAATLAVSTAALAPLTEQQSAASILQLRPDRPPTSAVVQKKGEGFDIHVRGPAPARVQRAAARPRNPHRQRTAKR